MLLGFDPGRDKCGLAVMGLDRKVNYQAVVPSKEAIAKIEELLAQYPISMTIIGDQTSSKQWRDRLNQHFPNLRLVSIDERFSSEEARKRYWDIYPPQGLMSLVPKGLRTPPRPIDDIVAIVLIERYLNRLVS